MSGSRLVPVFPLPDVVFFPETVLPLHIFESRYRTMVEDALTGDRRIAVALLKPGWQATYEGSPAYHEIATIGRIDEVERTPDGRYIFPLVGEARVRLGVVEKEKPYRLARAEEITERPIDEARGEVARAKLDLLASQGLIARELSRGEIPGIVLDERQSFAAVVNGVCASLPSEPIVRQRLLELDDLLERHRRASSLLDEVLERVLHLKALRSRDEGGSGLN